MALVRGNEALADLRTPLAVGRGSLGLRQSDAVFQHVRNLPPLIESTMDEARTLGLAISCVGASMWPRRAKDSYMPVFKASECAGRTLAAALSVPFVEMSHQEGHIAAGMWSGGMPQYDDFLSIHISGGTTELVSVRRHGGEPGYDTEILGGTSDLSAGQYIDRIGVAMGLSFPAGPHMDRLSAQGSGGRLSLPVSIRGTEVSFSGPASAAMRALKSGAAREDLAFAVLYSVGEAIARLAAAGINKTGMRAVLLVGGVASSGLIRNAVSERVRDLSGEAFCASPRYSTDNAVGVALLAMEVGR